MSNVKLSFDRKKKFVQFSVVTQDAEYEPEDQVPGYIDVHSIESFYEINDRVTITTESGDGFVVNNSIEYILEALNGVQR